MRARWVRVLPVLALLAPLPLSWGVGPAASDVADPEPAAGSPDMLYDMDGESFLVTLSSLEATRDERLLLRLDATEPQAEGLNDIAGAAAVTHKMQIIPARAPGPEGSSQPRRAMLRDTGADAADPLHHESTSLVWMTTAQGTLAALGGAVHTSA